MSSDRLQPMRFVVAATEDGMVRLDCEDLGECNDPECSNPDCDDYVFEGILTPGEARQMAAALLNSAQKAEEVNPLGAFLDEHKGEEL